MAARRLDEALARDPGDVRLLIARNETDNSALRKIGPVAERKVA